MKATHFLPPLLAAATLVLLGANAMPSAYHKHRLQQEHQRLQREMEAAQRVEARLQAEIDALANDPFYIERVFVETWGGVPQGALPFDAPDGDRKFD